MLRTKLAQPEQGDKELGLGQLWAVSTMGSRDLCDPAQRKGCGALVLWHPETEGC